VQHSLLLLLLLPVLLLLMEKVTGIVGHCVSLRQHIPAPTRGAAVLLQHPAAAPGSKLNPAVGLLLPLLLLTADPGAHSPSHPAAQLVPTAAVLLLPRHLLHLYVAWKVCCFQYGLSCCFFARMVCGGCQPLLLPLLLLLLQQQQFADALLLLTAAAVLHVQLVATCFPDGILLRIPGNCRLLVMKTVSCCHLLAGAVQDAPVLLRRPAGVSAVEHVS
jgi:hypothetical protein